MVYEIIQAYDEKQECDEEPESESLHSQQPRTLRQASKHEYNNASGKAATNTRPAIQITVSAKENQSRQQTEARAINTRNVHENKPDDQTPPGKIAKHTHKREKASRNMFSSRDRGVLSSEASDVNVCQSSRRRSLILLPLVVVKVSRVVAFALLD